MKDAAEFAGVALNDFLVGNITNGDPLGGDGCALTRGSETSSSLNECSTRRQDHGLQPSSFDDHRP